jgi:hypothetical protein
LKGDSKNVNFDRSTELFRRLAEYLQRRSTSRQARIIDESKASPEAGLRLYFDEWQRYKQFAKQVDHLFGRRGTIHWREGLDHHWGRPPTIWSLHLLRWKEAFFGADQNPDSESLSKIAEKYSEQADDPNAIMQPFQEIAALIENGPWNSDKEAREPEPVDYSVLCPVHNTVLPKHLGMPKHSSAPAVES